MILRFNQKTEARFQRRLKIPSERLSYNSADRTRIVYFMPRKQNGSQKLITQIDYKILIAYDQTHIPFLVKGWFYKLT